MRACARAASRPKGSGGKRGQDRLDEGFTAGPVLWGGAVHAVQQLGGCNGGDRDLFVRPQLCLQAPAHLGHGASRRQPPNGAFKGDEDGGV
jgi:hypothetical protein